MSRRLTVINECIRGSRIQTWIDLAPGLIRQHRPTSVIIHCGTNNIRSTLPLECLASLTKLIDIISNTDPNCTIAVSSLTTQRDDGRSAWIKEFNARLYDSCIKFNWNYINNDNITSNHLAVDGLHLRRSGTTLLAKNYISFLQFVTSMTLTLKKHK